VGLDCVAVSEALSSHVYDPARHLRPGEVEPAVANTKQRLDRFVGDAAPGPDNAALRKVAKSIIELAQHVKHSSTPTRREGGSPLMRSQPIVAAGLRSAEGLP